MWPFIQKNSLLIGPVILGEWIGISLLQAEPGELMQYLTDKTTAPRMMVGVVLLNLFVPFAVWAADQSASRPGVGTNNTGTAVSMKEVVITASRVVRDIQSEPSSAYRLEGTDNVLREASRTTPDSLKSVPSVMVQKTSYGQGSPYFRGFTGYRTLCMIDGIRLNNSAFRSGPNQYWNTVDALSIGSYELVMGPGSVLYGSDAVGGVMNALTIDPPDWTGEPLWERRLYYRGSAAEESNIGRVQVGGRLNEKLGFVGGYSFKSFGDLWGGKDVGLQEHSGYDEQDFDVKLNYYIDKNSTFTLGHQSVRQDDAWRTHRTVYGIDWEGLSHGDSKVESYDQARDLTYVKYKVSDIAGFINGLNLTLSRHAQGEDLYRVQKDDKVELSGFDIETWGVTVQFESDTALGQFVYGADYYHDNVNSSGRKLKADGSLDKIEIQGTVADDASYDIAGFFLQDTISCLDGRLDIIPGFRYTFASAEADKVKDPVGSQQISLKDDWQSVASSLRFLVPLTQDRNHVFYANVSQGFRAPSLMDLTRYDIARSNEKEQPSPDLDPEQYVAYEIGFKTRIEKLVSQISYYYTTIDDMIIRTPTGNIISESGTDYVEVIKKNSGNGYIHGVELSETYHFTPQWSLWFAGALMDGKVDSCPTSSGEKEREYISRLMPPTAEIGIRWQSERGKYWCELEGDFADKADKLSVEDEMDTQRIPPGGTPGYSVCHIRAGTQFTKSLALSLALENVFDEDYRIHGSGVNEAGRNLILTAMCNF